MKILRIVFFAVLCLLNTVCAYAQIKFEVKVKLNNPDNLPVDIFYPEGDKIITKEGVKTKDGTIVFSGTLREPVMARLRTSNLSLAAKNKLEDGKTGLIFSPNFQFPLTGGTITITGNVSEIYLSTVEGNEDARLWMTNQREIAMLTAKSWQARKKSIENNDEQARKEADEIEAAEARLRIEKAATFMKNYPNSFISAFFFSQFGSSVGQYELLGPQAKASFYIKDFMEKQALKERNQPGKAAADFTKKDIDGKTVSLSDFKGKYVLLDFWGSWCKPCRDSHPHLIEVYNKYKNKGLEIIGIADEQTKSIEEVRKTWKDAIKQDKLPWIQILNNEEIAQADLTLLYGISFYPTKVLIDKEGKLVARFGSQPEPLDQQMKQIFGE